MGVLALFSPPTQSPDVSATAIGKKDVKSSQDLASSQPTTGDPKPPLVLATSQSASMDTKDTKLPASKAPIIHKLPFSRPKGDKTISIPLAMERTKPGIGNQHFAFRALSLMGAHEHKPALSASKEHQKKVEAATALSKRSAKPYFSRSDRHAKQSALIVRSLIIGPSTTSSQLNAACAKPQLNKVKSQLIKPKSANKVIAQLRTLSSSGEVTAEGNKQGPNEPQGPIRAVCLAHSDAEEYRIHFAPLAEDKETSEQSFNFHGVSTISFERLIETFNEMNIIDLIKSPDLGLGQPGDGEGLLAGAVPTAETVIQGIVQITPQLMALGYATGRAVLPDHKGIYPPVDRMSVLTYWWGLELILPPPSLTYLANVQSVSGTVVNFLSALSLVNNGVREILPFVRYIAQFVDFEFNSIKAQDRGQGVVCAATWIMPAAMVPRPWDFPDPPEEPQDGSKDVNKEEKPVAQPITSVPPSEPVLPLPVVPLPIPTLAEVPNRLHGDPIPVSITATASSVNTK